MANKIVVLKVMVREEYAKRVANHLAGEARSNRHCGIADFCSRANIRILNHGTLIEDTGGLEEETDTKP